MKLASSEIEERLPMEDDQLIERIRRGDETAFEQLVTKYAKQVLSIAARFFRQSQAAEDIAQEVFIKVYQSLDDFQGGEPLVPWLRRITLNTCYDHLRRIKRRKEFTFSEITDEEAAWLDRQRFDEAIEAFEKEQSGKVAAELAEKVLQTLSPPDRMVLLLYERDGFSTAEIARTMRWSRANVKVRLFRARRSLRRALEQLLGPTQDEPKDETS